MPAIESISVEGFRSIASVSKLRLGPINLLIGPNGSGKSNFIGVFSFLHAIREGHLQDYVTRAGGAGKILHFGPKTTSKLWIHVDFIGSVNQYKIELVPTEADELLPSTERVLYWDKKNFSQPYDDLLNPSGKEAGISDKNGKKVADHVRRHLDRWRVYHFHDTGTASPMKRICDIHDNRFLRPDGANLPAFLYFLREKRKDSYMLIRRTVQRVAPFFDDFQLEPLNLDPSKIRLEWKHKGSEAYFDASSFSDGTLRFIALATLFLQPSDLRPSVVLVDEPELGLHPYAITLLASLVQQCSTKSQVILSTQSPMLLDHFEPQDVLVANRVHGATEFSRLNADGLKEWLEEYSLGQLWEKNEIGGRPTGE